LPAHAIEGPMIKHKSNSRRHVKWRGGGKTPVDPRDFMRYLFLSGLPFESSARPGKSQTDSFQGLSPLPCGRQLPVFVRTLAPGSSSLERIESGPDYLVEIVRPTSDYASSVQSVRLSSNWRLPVGRLERLVDLIWRYWLAALNLVYEILQLRPLVHVSHQGRSLGRLWQLATEVFLFCLELPYRDRPLIR
jgi:hypothetical protein